MRMAYPYQEHLIAGQTWAKQEASGEVEGLFGPGSPAWTVGRELALMLGGGRALVLQLADPVVAEGVAQNSRFRSNLIARARRTFANVYGIFFGDLDTALKVGARTHAIHRQVKGTITAATCPARAGEAYEANDPEHLLWVWATLADTSWLVYTRMNPDVTPAFAETWYGEYRRFAAVTGVPPELIPATFADFQAFFAARVERLYVGDTLRALCLDLFRSPLTAGRLDEVLTIGVLPDALKEAVPWPWNASTARQHELAWRAGLGAFRRMPSALRFAPAYHQGARRVAIANRTGTTFTAEVLDRIDRVIDLPFSLR